MALSSTPEDVAASIRAEGLDPDYRGMPATKPTPWIIYALMLLAVYFLWGDD